MGDQWKNIKAWFQTKQAQKRKEQEEEVGNVSMNDGDHGTIFGFNRNIILGIFLGSCAITAIAIIFAIDEPSESEKQPAPKRQQQAASSTASRSQTNQYPVGYEELAKADAQFGARRGAPQQGRGNGTSSSSSGQSAAPVVAPTASIPAIPHVVQAPVSLPSSTPAEEDKEQAAYMQRMKSAISFGLSGTGSSGSNQTQGAAIGAPNPGNAQGGESPVAFGEASTAPQQMVQASTVSYAAPGKYTLQAGTVIPVVLCTGINSDIGGQVVAQVQQDMYDSATGRNLLIPAGSKILGTYGKGSPNNSGRVEITFTSIILPDGGTFAVGNSLIAMDGAGYAGVSGKVNRHTGSTLSAGMFSSALAALGSVAAGNTGSSSNTYSAGQLAMQGAMANLMNASAQLFQQGTNRQMTVTAKPGTMFSVYVAQGLILQRGGAR